MKPICYSVLLIVFTGLLACKEFPQPSTNDLSGTWILFQRQIRDGNSWVSKPIASSSPQTITLTYPHLVSTSMEDDTTFAGITHFELGGGGTGIVGPYIHFKKSADSRTGRTFYYTPGIYSTPGNGPDTLRLIEFGQTGEYRYVQYSFRRQ